MQCHAVLPAVRGLMPQGVIGWFLLVIAAGVYCETLVDRGALWLLWDLTMLVVMQASRAMRAVWRRRTSVLYAAGAALFICYAGSQLGPPGADALTVAPTMAHLHRTLNAFDRVGILDARGRAAAQSYVYDGSGVMVGMNMMLPNDVNELAASLGIAPALVPAMIVDPSAPQTKPPPTPSRRITTLNLGDSGAGLHAINSSHYAVPGTIVANTTPIATANGIVVPPHKCHARIPMRMDDGTVHQLQLHDAVILTDSAHNLISLGLLARDQHVGTWIAPGNGASKLVFADGTQAPLHNVGVLVLPDIASDVAPAMLAHEDSSPVVGGEGRTNVTWETLALPHSPTARGGCCARSRWCCATRPLAWG